ncbi:uncharacterized protein BDZ99DRAFT_51233 [Mytilinidion resinicola]|uniref:Uncharacterized protein n=1 Tax=Mytilinidion resinicola TaxID=574789 RepID=A0A6A6YHJ8_9PEZI|nr:uncharacterized protein BDZ99DRAFT_51233 [Mytilinidion resinicola]KAF2808292.1 hypothetical protein BDZ99DRAFT_51233 [Mytilinidion resinicola]
MTAMERRSDIHPAGSANGATIRRRPAATRVCDVLLSPSEVLQLIIIERKDKRKKAQSGAADANIKEEAKTEEVTV